MAKDNIFDYDTIAANNLDIAGISCAEGTGRAKVNNWTRAMMAQLKRELADQGTAIAAASTTSIFATGTSGYVHISGSGATITGLGTAIQGTRRVIEIEGVNTIANGASLILPGAANITTAAGDMAEFVAEASNVIRCLWYVRASGQPVAAFNGVLTSTDAGATEAPDFIADRNSATPLAGDIIGGFILRGRDSAGNATDYAKLKGKILDPTNTGPSEDGAAIVAALIAGVETDILTVGPGVQIGAPTGADKGAGTLNVAGGIYKNGALQLGNPPAALYQDQKADGTAGGTSVDGSWQSRVLNTEVFDTIGATLASNQVTLPAGTYIFFGVGAFYTRKAALRIFNVTDATETAAGPASDTGISGLMHNPSVFGAATIASSKTFRLQYQVDAARVGDGLGQATPWSGDEVYASLLIVKIV